MPWGTLCHPTYLVIHLWMFLVFIINRKTFSFNISPIKISSNRDQRFCQHAFFNFYIQKASFGFWLLSFLFSKKILRKSFLVDKCFHVGLICHHTNFNWPYSYTTRGAVGLVAQGDSGARCAIHEWGTLCHSYFQIFLNLKWKYC